MNLEWYCARTKPKHEHIAASNVRKQLSLEVFHPQLRMERHTKRGLVRTVEPLFPCYIFVRFCVQKHLDALRYVNGLSSIVHFGDRIPFVPEPTVDELRQYFSNQEQLMVEERMEAGAEVVVGGGAFSGMNASVLRVLPAGGRVQILLEILGRPTSVEVDRRMIRLEKNTVADLVPLLAAPQPVGLRA